MEFLHAVWAAVCNNRGESLENTRSIAMTKVRVAGELQPAQCRCRPGCRPRLSVDIVRGASRRRFRHIIRGLHKRRVRHDCSSYHDQVIITEFSQHGVWPYQAVAVCQHA